MRNNIHRFGYDQRYLDGRSGILRSGKLPEFFGPVLAIDFPVVRIFMKLRSGLLTHDRLGSDFRSVNPWFVKNFVETD